MKKLTLLAAGLLLMVPTLAFPDTFSLRVGYFMPGASTNIVTHPDSLWAIEFDQMSFSMDDFRGVAFGVGYEYFVGANLSLAFTFDSFRKSRLGYYRDFVQYEFGDESFFAFPAEIYEGDSIIHSFGVNSSPLQLSLKLLPLGRKTKLIPFIGGGAGLYFWSIKMYGDMVNFGDDSWFYDFETETAYQDPVDPALQDEQIYPVEIANGRENGAHFGFHAFAGFQIPIGYRATLEAEARYHWAKAKLKDWFWGFEDFDLGGLAITVGLNFWF